MLLDISFFLSLCKSKRCAHWEIPVQPQSSPQNCIESSLGFLQVGSHDPFLGSPHLKMHSFSRPFWNLHFWSLRCKAWSALSLTNSKRTWREVWEEQDHCGGPQSWPISILEQESVSECSLKVELQWNDDLTRNGCFLETEGQNKMKRQILYPTT